MKHVIFYLCVLSALIATSFSQSRELSRRGLPFLRAADQQILQQQSDGFFKAIDPIADMAGVHAVNVFSSGKMVARGTVTAEGILTKWSELVSRGDSIWVVGHDGVKRHSFVKGVYLEYDLALLDYGGGLPAVELKQANTVALGDFLIAVGPAREAHGLGVVSVTARSLRESDKAFLGVRMDFNPIKGGGVRLESVEKGSAAARAGLVAGDVVTQVNGKKVDGLHEMGNFLQSLKPGDQIVLHFRRDKREFSVDVILGARPEVKQFSPQRMKQMKRMGGTINDVAEGFPDVLQSDMQIEAIDAGSPVFDLDGNFAGLVVAKASRIKAYIITPDKLSLQLETKPDMTASLEKQTRLIDQRREGISPAEAKELRQLRDIIERAERRIFEIESK
ncbi:MAG: PDZ domain-containing protein [Rubritalea sp.]|uniref:S1C family serine protease n=1 Tax=Rubritalea sp. TaxID=2109375 RepID=UPI00324246EA